MIPGELRAVHCVHSFASASFQPWSGSAVVFRLRFSPAHFSPLGEVQTAFAVVVLVFGRHEGLFVLD